MDKKSNAIVVDVEPRAALGKNANRRLRAAGKVPANVYGLKIAPFAVAVNPRSVEEILHTASGRNTIFTLTLGKQESRSVMLREIQRDPVSERLVHVDFVRFDPKKRIHVKVPVRLLGTPIGVKNEAGVLDFVHREVEVECLPAEIPEHLDVDVSELHNNQHVSVHDLHVDPAVKILEDPETILAVVAEPRQEVEVVEEAVAEAAAEPGEAGEAEKEAEPESEGKGKGAEK